MTTKAAFEQVLEALRNATDTDWDTSAVSKQARAALDAWEGRERLQDDSALQTAVRLNLPPDAELVSTRVILDGIDVALFGGLHQASADAYEGRVR